MNGFLLVDKPTGWTSHDVVAKIRSVLRQQSGHKVKVGHTGTLDPFATGLLILVVGSYTKRAAEFSKLDKTYEAELTLGVTSTTGDIEGKITPQGMQKPAKDQIAAILRQFEGNLEQTPHIYSAVKIGGQRAYKLARAGKEVALEPREVTIYEISILNYDYPQLHLLTRVSSGTYIRSLAEDIGQKLGTGAYLSALRRTKVGNFNVKQTLKVEGMDLSTPDVLESIQE